MTLHAIEGFSQLYADAVVSDDRSRLLFLSVWGLDTAIQELLARLSLPGVKGGIRELMINTTPGESVWHSIADPDDLQKLTGRSAYPAAHVRGLVQLWLYDSLAAQLDYAAHRGLLLRQHGEADEAFASRYWAAIQAICPVPLLAAWHDVIQTFEGYGWCERYRGLAVDAYRLDFSHEDVEKRLTECIQSGQLRLPAKPH